QTVAGKAKPVAEAVSKLNGVSSAYAVTGTFDVIALVEASDFKVLSELVLAKIHAIVGVARTETAIIYE
ncbi:MAG: Lrp/AsnC ligand binding domain-containing protein, partial [Candidatus Thermoplasmatota archaeon]|nr:Lrp/AsnC ligand binding domain-containing protein [Candidatus Thermoplasmatota archaeon]